MTADLVVRNAHVHTVEELARPASAVALAADRITWIGDDAGAAGQIGPVTEVIDAHGGTLLPGFVDAHNHVRLGSNPGAVQLSGATSLEELRADVSAFADAHPDAEWIEGEGWNYTAIPGGRPTKAMLDGLIPGRPAFLFSYDVHTVWLNREAMTRLRVTRDAEWLPWGHVEKDADGEPTGYVTDFATLGISEEGQCALAPHVPGYAPGAQYERLVASLDLAAAYGITTIVEPQNGLDDLALFARARDDGALRSRLVAAMLCLPGTTGERLDALEDARNRFDDD
ncbi:MAG: amidohydrolase family protein, partial [Actinomycetota bacterium]